MHASDCGDVTPSTQVSGVGEDTPTVLGEYCSVTEWSDTVSRLAYSDTNITVVDNLPGEIIFIAKQMEAG